MLQGFELTAHGSPAPVSFSYAGAQGTIAGESVEYLEMRLRIEQRLLIALAVNIDQIRTQVAQQRLGGELVVDEGLVTSGGGKLTTDDQLVSCAQPCILEQRLEIRIWSNREKPFNRAAISA